MFGGGALGRGEGEVIEPCKGFFRRRCVGLGFSQAKHVLTEISNRTLPRYGVVCDLTRMTLIRPRLSEYHGLSLAQASVPFAIPFLNEDLPLYVDPFLLWKSPSQQDYALHSSMMQVFNRIGASTRQGNQDEAAQLLVALSECEEVGLGLSLTRSGKRIGRKVADDILGLFSRVPRYQSEGITHIEKKRSSLFLAFPRIG